MRSGRAYAPCSWAMRLEAVFSFFRSRRQSKRAAVWRGRGSGVFYRSFFLLAKGYDRAANLRRRWKIFPTDEASVVVSVVWFLGTAPAEPGVAQPPLIRTIM